MIAMEDKRRFELKGFIAKFQVIHSNKKLAWASKAFISLISHIYIYNSKDKKNQTNRTKELKINDNEIVIEGTSCIGWLLEEIIIHKAQHTCVELSREFGIK